MLPCLFHRTLMLIAAFFLVSASIFGQMKVNYRSDVFVRDTNIINRGALNMSFNEQNLSSGFHDHGLSIFINPSKTLNLFRGTLNMFDITFDSPPFISNTFRTRKMHENNITNKAHGWFTGYSNEISESVLTAPGGNPYTVANFVGFLNRASNLYSTHSGFKNEYHTSLTGVNNRARTIYGLHNVIANNPNLTDYRAIYGEYNDFYLSGGSEYTYVYGRHDLFSLAGVEGDPVVPFEGKIYGTYTAIPTWVSNGEKYGIYTTLVDTSEQYAAFFEGKVVVNGTFINTSDEKLKEEITELPDGLKTILAIQPKKYKLIGDKNLNALGERNIHFGVMAQQIQTVAPDLVREITQPGKEIVKQEKTMAYESVRKTGVDGKEYFEEVQVPQFHSKIEHLPDEKYLGVNYIEMIPILIKAIQEQQAMIQDLQKRLEELEK